MQRLLLCGLLVLCFVAAVISPPEARADTREATRLSVRRNPIVGQDPAVGADQPADAAAEEDGRSWWPYAALAAAGGAAAILSAMALRRART